MKVKHDKEVDILYIKSNDKSIDESNEDKPVIILDYAKDGYVLGIEILYTSSKILNLTF